MKLGAIDTGGKPGIFDLLKAAPKRAEPAKAVDASESFSRGERSGFRDALRGSKPDGPVINKGRADDADPVKPQGGEDLEAKATNDQPEPTEQSSSDREPSKAEKPDETTDSTSAQTNEEAEADAGGEQLAKQAEANAQSEQAQQTYLALGQVFGGVKAAQTDGNVDPNASAKAEQQAIAALEKAYQEAISRQTLQPGEVQIQNTFKFTVAPTTAGASADGNSDSANAESNQATQLSTNSLATQNTSAGTQAYVVPDQSSAEVKPVANTNAQYQPMNANTQAQALPQINADDNDAVNTARLTRGLSSAIQQRGGAVTLRLTPPEMGTVRIQMQITGTNLSASLHAESASAQTLLNTQLAQLRTALETQGMNVEKLSVQPLASTSASNNANQSQNQNDNQQQSQANQQNNHGEGRSRGQYSGDSGERSGRDDGDQQQGRQARRGFFDRLSDAAQDDAA